MKSTDITSGDIVIVRRPHQRPSTVTMFDSIDEAFNAYLNEMTYISEKNLNEYINNSGFDPEMDAETIKSITERIHEAGIKDNEPFIEFAVDNCSETEFYKADDFSIKDAVYACAADDMNGAEMFTAEKGETYGNFQKRILKFYEEHKVHNAPSKNLIENKILIDDVPNIVKKNNCRKKTKSEYYDRGR